MKKYKILARLTKTNKPIVESVNATNVPHTTAAVRVNTVKIIQFIGKG